MIGEKKRFSSGDLLYLFWFSDQFVQSNINIYYFILYVLDPAQSPLAKSFSSSVQFF